MQNCLFLCTITLFLKPLHKERWLGFQDMLQITGNSYFWDNLLYSSNFKETGLLFFFFFQSLKRLKTVSCTSCFASYYMQLLDITGTAFSPPKVGSISHSKVLHLCWQSDSKDTGDPVGSSSQAVLVTFCKLSVKFVAEWWNLLTTSLGLSY